MSGYITAKEALEALRLHDFEFYNKFIYKGLQPLKNFG